MLGILRKNFTVAGCSVRDTYKIRLEGLGPSENGHGCGYQFVV